MVDCQSAISLADIITSQTHFLSNVKPASDCSIVQDWLVEDINLNTFRRPSGAWRSSCRWQSAVGAAAGYSILRDVLEAISISNTSMFSLRCLVVVSI